MRSERSLPFWLVAILALAAASLSAVILLVLSGGSQAAPAAAVNPKIIDATQPGIQSATADQLPCTKVDQPLNFDAFSVGQTFEGLPLTYVLRYCGDSPRANYVSYIYGHCRLDPDRKTGSIDGGCPPPVQVQSFPACERSLTDYEAAPGVPYPHGQPETLSGGAAEVPFNEGGRLEVYTGDSTVVIFGSDPPQAQRAVAALRQKPQTGKIGAPAADAHVAASLPPPAQGAMAGTLTCPGG